MKYIKMLGLAAVAAAALMAFVGAGTASAKEGVLCSTTTGNNACPAGQKWVVPKVLHFTSEETVKLATTGGITASTCSTATVKGTLTANPDATGTATGVNEVISWGTGATPCTKPATTIALGSLVVERIAGTSNGTVKAEGEIKVTIAGLFEGETCNYGVKAGTSIGEIIEGNPATYKANAVASKLAGHSCFFGPETTKWTGAYLLTEPKNTTLSVSSK